MSDNYTDPSGNTQAFRTFVHTPEAEAPAGAAGRLPMLIGGAVVAAVLLALAVWLAVG